MSQLSNADKQLTAAQQEQIKQLKQAYETAKTNGDTAAMASAHREAEAIRQTAGYSGGASGSDYRKLGANQGGQTADQVAQWVADYEAVNYDPKNGWTNGYSTAMNSRSKANYIRQQMEANSKAWHTATPEQQAYLHDQNVQLAKILQDATGTSDKNHRYDPMSGKWYTWNTNVGYGQGLTQPNIVNSQKQYLGYTDEEIARWLNDTSRYHNFVDQRTIRKGLDESSGFTGQYSQFVNGPYVQLLAHGTNNVNPGLYVDAYDDGFGLYEKGVGGDIVYDELGNVIPYAPALKHNNATSKYTNQFTAFPENGVLQANILSPAQSGRVDGDRYGSLTDLGTGYRPNTADDRNLQALPDRRVQGVGGYGGMIDQMYDAALQAQLAELQAAYAQQTAQLNADQAELEADYRDQSQQTAGEAARQAANWREMANAYGLNSGTVGQATLAQNNQLQSDLTTLTAAKAAALAALQQERQQLGQEYQLAMNQAAAENDFKRLSALYEEAIRVEKNLQSQAKKLLE